MLGLGLAITVGKRILGNAIDSLLSTLKGRATYYENGSASKATIKAIDNADVLDKASILLTPTATSNARVHSVKTYTGDELISGDFTNGTTYPFTTFTTSGNNITSAIVSSAFGGAVSSAISLTSGHKYKVTFDYTKNSGNDLRVVFSSSVNGAGTQISNNELISASGSYTKYFTITSTTTGYLQMGTGNSGHSLNASISNISVTDVSSDFIFDRASSATRINSDGLVQDMQSITDPELVLNGDFEELGDNVLISNNSTFDSGVGDWISYGAGTTSHSTDKLEVSVTASEGGAMIPTNSLFTGGQSGKLLKVRAKLWLGTMTNTAFKTYIGGVQESVTLSSTPTYYDFYLKPTGSGNLIIYKTSIGGSAGTFFIDDVSVQQVDPNDRWSAGNKWSISGGTANKAADATSNISQAIDGISGKLQKVVFTVSNYGGSGGVGASADGSNYTQNEGNGTFTEYITPNSNNLYIRASYSFVGSIDNVSVKEATFSDDVDLARINYDSNGDNGHILLEPTSTNLVTYSEDFSQWGTSQGTPTPNYGISPDGTQSSTRYVFSGSDQILRETVTTSSSSTGSIYIKGNNGETIKFGVQGSESLFTLDGTWQRFEKQGTATSNAITVNTFSGATARDIELWGAQLENLSYATSYIPTLTGSTVTRATETLTGSGNSTLINSTEGVLYAEIAMLSEDDKASNNQLFLNDGTSLQRVGIFTESAGDIRVQIRDNDEATDIRNLTALDQSQSGVDVAAFNKIAIQYKSGENKLFVNGSRITDTNFDSMVFNFSSLDNLDFDSGANSNYFRGKCKALAVFNEALEDDELELLTGVTNYGSFGELASANGYTII